jgi:hypothetical protein
MGIIKASYGCLGNPVLVVVMRLLSGDLCSEWLE